MKSIEPIRWTVSAAAMEFGIDPKTLSKRIRAASIEPGTDGRLSTAQVCAAIYTDLEAEQTRLTAAKADLAELEREAMLKELLPTVMVDRVVSRILLEYRGRVMAANIPAHVKRHLLEPLAEPTIDEYFEEQQKSANVDE